MRISQLISIIGLSSCLATSASIQAADSAPAAPLTEEATAALAGAEARVKQARNLKGLWTSAEEALNQAMEAAKKGNSEAVVKFATRANHQAFLGMAQLNYPLTD